LGEWRVEKNMVEERGRSREWRVEKNMMEERGKKQRMAC